MNKRYEAICRLPHYVSDKRQRMSLHDRAAQFSPFAALTGYEEAVQETARRTDKRCELTERQQEKLNQQVQKLIERAHERPYISVTYFVPDSRRAGGAYVNYTGRFRFLDEAERKMKFTDRTEIPVDAVSHIEFIAETGNL